MNLKKKKMSNLKSLPYLIVTGLVARQHAAHIGDEAECVQEGQQIQQECIVRVAEPRWNRNRVL